MSITAFCAPPGDPRDDATASTIFEADAVVPLVGVLLRRPLAESSWRPPNRLDGGDDLDEHRAVVDVRSGGSRRERDAVGVDHNMALRARFAAIRRVRAGVGPPSGERAPPPSPRPPDPSRCDRPVQADRATLGATCPTHLPPASRVAAASRSSRCRNPSPVTGTPTESRSRAPRRCPSEPADRPAATAHLFFFAPAAAAAVIR